MDELNMYHVLADNIEELGHGVQLCPQDGIASKTLVCFLDDNGAFHFGFGYKNGSNLRVVCWENGARLNKTTPKADNIIAFHEVTTMKAFGGNFNANDFDFQWFDDAARQNAENELVALRGKQDRISKIVKGTVNLTIQQLDEVIEKIKELKNN